jgi:Tat protein translocase TatB subunit
MFDIGFSELVVIGGVALVVLGPEKLAVVARSAGKLAGKAQRYVNEAKADLAREGELAELRHIKSELESAGRDLSQSFTQQTSHLQHRIQQEYAALSTPIPLINDTAPTHPTMLDTAIQFPAMPVDMAAPSYPQYQAALSPTMPPVSPEQAMAWHGELGSLKSDLDYMEQRMANLKECMAAALPHTVQSANPIPAPPTVHEISSQ